MPRLRSGSKVACGAACGSAFERDGPRSCPRVAVTRWRMQQRIHIGAAAKTPRAQCTLACCNNVRIVRSPACLGRYRGGNGGAETKDNSTRRYRSTTASRVLHWNLYRSGPVVTYGLEP